MEPKEKAAKLRYKYSVLLDLKTTDEKVLKCALIAVDEILLNEPNKAYFIKNTWVTPKTYWIEVKNELEKL
jgi:hypothetical protein